MRRVAVCIPTLRGAGCERHVARLLFLLAGKFDVTLVIQQRVIDYKIPTGLRIVEIGGDLSTEHGTAYKLGRAFRRVSALSEIFSSEKFDAILSFIDTNNVLVAAAHAASRQGTPLVLVERTVGPEIFKHNPYARRFKAPFQVAARYAYGKADRVVTISAAMSRFLKKTLWLNRRIDVIYNGVNPETFHAARPGESPRSSLDARFMAAPRRILHVGRFDTNKDQTFLLEAFARLSEPDLSLSFIGVGDRAPSVQAHAARLGLEGRVNFLGWRDDVAEYMRAADLLALSSHYEGVPNVVLEAMASGLPVVTTNCSEALPEIALEPAGCVVVDDRDPDLFAQRISSSLSGISKDMPRRRRMSAAILERFDEQTSDSKYAAMLDELLSARPGVG